MPDTAKRRQPPEPLFPRLRGGHHELSAEQIAAHQRARLMGAMVEAVSRSGYPKVTIGELVGLAGVSKSAFYRHFDSKQDCFLATFDAIIAQGTGRVGEAYRAGRAEGGLEGSFEAGLAAFAEVIATEPAAAALTLVDSLALGTAGVAHREAAAERFEALVAQGFAAHGRRLSELQARVIVAGCRRGAYRALRAGEPASLAGQVPALRDWALSYRGPAEFPVPPLPPAAEPAVGWSAPPGGEAARAGLGQRRRIAQAAAQLAAEGGYGALGISAISERAGVSNEAFYEHFDSKQAALLAAFDELAAEALAATAAAFESQPDWARGVAAAAGALLRHIAAEPVFARIAFFELPASSAAGLEHTDTALEAFTAYLRPERFGASAPNEVPAAIVDAIGGGLWAALQHELACGRPASLPGLAPQLAAVALAPFGL